MSKDLRQNTATRSERLRSTSYTFPRGLHFHLTKLPACLPFSDGRLGTMHFLKPPAFGQDTHALPGDLPARTRTRGRAGEPRSNTELLRGEPRSRLQQLPGSHHRPSSPGPEGEQVKKSGWLRSSSHRGPGFSLWCFVIIA